MDLCLRNSAFLLIALCLFLAGRLGAQRVNLNNTDVREPIVRVSPADDTDLFGWATVLHQIQEVVPSDDLNAAAQKTRIIIGAPNGTFPGGLPLTDPGQMAENQTGLVYSCPVLPGECEGIQGDLSLYINMPDNDMSTGELRSPLDTEGRLFDQAPDAMVLSTSSGVRLRFENKMGQLMGATLFSDGVNLVACAPRWTSTQFTTTDAQPRGVCFYSERDLTNFNILQPCTSGAASSANTRGEGYCMAGVSATKVDNLFAIAAPGYNLLQGAVYYGENRASIASGRGLSQQPNFQGNLVNIDNQYQGFQTTTGFISQRRSPTQPTQIPDHIATVPRYNGSTYTGRVNIVNTNDIQAYLDITAEGQQMGEFFGYSVAAADLNGDGFDELLVGAPMYTNIALVSVERGRVYVFNNTGGNLSPDSVILEGNISRGRFGTSVTNLGDIDDDGYEDVAIGAPYEDMGSNGANNQGSVYIYYGRADIMEFGQQEPFQITAGQLVDNVQGLNELRTFGWSLSSGVDVDNNEYRDLSIGAYESKTVVLLRTIPVASVNVMFDAVPAVNLEVSSCILGPCFNLTIRATYTGRGLDGALDIPYNISETLTTPSGTAVPSRLVFDTQNSTEVTRTLSFTGPGVEFVDTVTVYARANVADTVSPYQLQIEIQDLERTTMGDNDGNQTLSDLSAYPRLRRMGAMSTSVSIVNPCGEVCDSDVALRLIEVRYLNSSQQRQNQFVAGAVSVIEFELEYSNVQGPQNAIGATLSYNLPTIFMGSSRVGQENRLCTTNNRTVTCNLPNPLTPQQRPMREVFMLVVSDQITGDEPDVDITFFLDVSQGSRENNTANNNVTRRLSVSGVADIAVTISIVSEISNFRYSMSPPEDVVRVNQLGELVQVLVSVSNRGPSTIQNARLVTYFPARSAVTGQNYFLYPSEAQEMAGDNSEVVCDVTGLNPDMLVITNTRRRRSVTSSPFERTKRQDASTGLDCTQDPESCLPIVCDITRLKPSVNAGLNINSYVDDRFYAAMMSMATYTLVVNSHVNITDNFLLPEANVADNTVQLMLQVRPPDVMQVPPDNTLLIHAIIWPTLAVIVIIVILAIILYFCGFFRRKKKPGEGEAEGDFDVNKFQVQQVKEGPEEKGVEATQL